MNKKLTIKHQSESGDTASAQHVHALSIEQALKDVADQISAGEVSTPCTLEFDGPGGLHFTVKVESVDDVHELNAQGFMF